VDFERYKRQIIMPQVGIDGQLKLKEVSVLIIGLGGLGCPAATYLNGLGIGRIGLVDGDIVEKSNLARQPIYRQEDIGQSKVEVASDFLFERNPRVLNILFPEYISADNIKLIAQDYDYILDGSDQIEIRYLLDQYCKMNKKTYVYGSVYQFEGQLALFNHEQYGTSYKTLFPNPKNKPPSCNENGILGFLPGIIGTMQALEIVKHSLGLYKEEPKLIHYNAMNHKIYSTKLPSHVQESVS